MNTLELKVLIIKEGQYWTAVCLDCNVAVQVKYIGEVVEELTSSIRATFQAYKDEDANWKDHLEPAPKEFWEMYNNAIPIKLYIDDQLRKLFGDDESPRSTDSRMYEKVLA